ISCDKLSRSRAGNKARAAQVPLEMTLPTDDINTAGRLGERCDDGTLKARALLLRQRDRELAVAHASWQSLDEFRNRGLAIGADQLGECRKQARLRKAIAVDAIMARLRPCLVEIAERGLLLLVVGQRVAGEGRERAHEFNRQNCASPLRDASD